MKRAATSPLGGMTAPDMRSPADDDAVQLLQITARLHAARGNPVVWAAALRACRDWFGCSDALVLAADKRLPGPDDFDALAGRVTHCADYGGGVCGSAEDELRRARCAALASHLHEAAIAQRRALEAALFDQLPPTWVLDRDGHVQVANAPAKAFIASGDYLSLSDGCLSPSAAGAAEKLRRTLVGLAGETRFAWPGYDGSETALLLRPLAANGAVAATLLADPISVAELAPRIGVTLAVTPRQSELAAYLLTGHLLSDAARRMGISRNTASGCPFNRSWRFVSTDGSVKIAPNLADVRVASAPWVEQPLGTGS